MANQNRYLTKSRFILALECPTKLFYTNKLNRYANNKEEDSFMYELAKGGMQVGELAKFYFVEDPFSPAITIQAGPQEYEKALEETQEKLKAPGKVVLAEAAFLFDNCYVRADVIVKNENDELFLYEVKSKSYREGDDKFIFRNNITSEWSPYLNDVAFQKWVISNSSGKKVKAHLCVVDKDAKASVAGLAKFFKVSEDATGRASVTCTSGLTRKDLGDALLRIFAVDEECEIIYSQPLKLNADKPLSFEEGIKFLSNAYQKDQKVAPHITPGCGKCEFYSTAEQKHKGLYDGRRECWVDGGNVSPESFDGESLVTELWGGNAGGGKSPVQKLIDLKKFLLKDAVRTDFETTRKISDDGMTPHDRRDIQILKAKNRDFTPYIAKDELKKAIEEFKYPLHFIDFETTATALPWFKGMRPYQGIAFQFSHHIVQENGSVEHFDQYLSFEPGVFPNFEFVRRLKESLKNDLGSIFRYHVHENSYLNFIYAQLDEANEVADKQELQDFIRTITEWDDKDGKRVSGPRNMIDLYKLVLRYFYSLHSKGSNSLKDILPAAIKSFPLLQEKYSKSIYGKGLEIPSLNFNNKIWVTEDHQFDPYKTLDPVFPGYSAEDLDRLVQDTEVIADGGSAMMAYNMLQYSEIPLEQREKIKEALYKYCELDTMAMVMLYEGLKSSI